MTTARPEPDDFDAFWRGLAERARAVAPNTAREPADETGAGVVRFTSVDGVRLGGWLTLPHGEITSAVIVAHGYGGRSALDPRWAPSGAAVLYPVARGMAELSLTDGIPSFSKEHVLHGIGSRETYVHGGCAADVWCAVSALQEVLETPLGASRGGLRLGFFGPSFGGGIGAMAVPWDERIDAASLYVPSFGAHADRLGVSCVGSGAAVAEWVAEHPDAWSVLDYFDAATSARRLRVPTIVAPAAEDQSVPPVGQRAVAATVPEAYRTVMPMTAGHRSYPQEEQEMAAFAQATRTLFAGTERGSLQSR
ncbi:cephalosporin-C deacetylase [Microbacterium sp. W4I4]|uniref:acetylxylan esterase n=1 Tax=Microbacterium sp. W4I4 TaxID=3042295 RepID=UPI00278427EF|nr:acetylxylan esterase [Microbacterium sp. W4I4]MDQ0614478.1 cephalosporin-C deacetylase [Microbacterium sp. W4I4]